MKGIRAGKAMANVIIEWSQLFYNEDTKRRVLTACRDRLTGYIKTIPPSSRGDAKPAPKPKRSVELKEQIKYDGMKATDILERVFPGRVREPRAEVAATYDYGRYLVIKTPGHSQYHGMAIPTNLAYIPTKWRLIETITFTELDSAEGRHTKAVKKRFEDKIQEHIDATKA